MKLSKLAKIIMMLCLAVTLAGSGVAADTHKANFQIFDSVQVNGTELAPGSYVAQWTGEGPDVQLSITRAGKAVATVPAKVVPLDQKADKNSSEVQNSSKGKELSSLQFAGKKYSLAIVSDATAASAGSVK